MTVPYDDFTVDPEPHAWVQWHPHSIMCKVCRRSILNPCHRQAIENDVTERAMATVEDRFTDDEVRTLLTDVIGQLYATDDDNPAPLTDAQRERIEKAIATRNANHGPADGTETAR